MGVENVNLNKVSTKSSDSDNKVRPSKSARVESNFRKVLGEREGENQEGIAETDDATGEGDASENSLFALSATKKPTPRSGNQSKDRPVQPLTSDDSESDITFGEGASGKLSSPFIFETGLKSLPLDAENKKTSAYFLGSEEIADASALVPEFNVDPDLLSQSSNSFTATPSTDDGTDLGLDEAERMKTAVTINKKGRADGGYAMESEETTEVASQNESSATKTRQKKQEFSQENPDLASFAGTQQPMAKIEPSATSTQNDAIPSESIRDIAAHLIEKIHTMRSEGKTETVITLKNPPILDGAVIKLSAMDGAKREFDISFTQLTEKGKLFLDRKLTEENLAGTLERKGIIVHQMITTTQTEAPLMIDSENLYGRDQQREDQNQRQQRGQGNTEDEEA